MASRRSPFSATTSALQPRCSQGLFCACVLQCSGQTSPTDATRKPKAIKPLGIVLGNTRGEDRRFPSRQRQLAAVELFQHELQTLGTFHAMFWICALPREQKSIKILWRDRLDLRP